MNRPENRQRRETVSEAPVAADEARLMALARHDPEAFAPLYEHYFPRVYAYCLRRVDNAQEAEDLCSLVFARALTGLHGYRGGMVAAWLFRIAHNVVVNHHRARPVTIALEDDALPADGPAEGVEWDEERRIVGELVQALPDDQRNLLSLTLDAGLSSQEAGAVIGKSAGAVRVQVHRIVKHLRARYLQVTGENTR